MKKSSPSPILQDHLNDYTSLEENPVVHFLTQYGRISLYALLAVIAAGVIIYRLNSSHQEKSETDFWNAEKAFRILASPAIQDANSSAEKDALSQLNTILEQHPQLHAKYDGLIAQMLLNRGDVTAAAPFAQSALERTKEENQPFYTDYAKTTLLIADKHYEDALAQALALQNKMNIAQQEVGQSDQHQFGNTLFAFNLFRVGLLQQQLGLTNEELKTWQEWKQMVQSKAFEVLLFSEGRVSLTDYINSREMELKR